MSDLDNLKLLIKSKSPAIVIESSEEKRVLKLCHEVAKMLGISVSKWTVTTGLQRLEHGYSAQKFNAEPNDVLRHIKASDHPGIYILLDFHPYLEDPINTRLIREIAQNDRGRHLVFLSPKIEIPNEIISIVVKFSLSLPDFDQIMQIIRNVAIEWTRKNPGKKVIADKKSVEHLARNLLGLTSSAAERLARKAVWNDGMIDRSDIKMIQEAKYELIDQQGILSFEYETTRFADVGGLKQLKQWLHYRRAVFHGQGNQYGLTAPKGMLLLGVQGCGKSLAAKAVAGVWAVPLLRLDFAALYNKFMGETERNLRESLRTAEVMAPCVLWIDEIEKGLSAGSSDDGVSKRILGTMLTWMNEKEKPVFVVATANDVTSLPPELLRKGRFDELFFVDLPDEETRAEIFRIQLAKRKLNPNQFDVNALAKHCPGFSGSEIEQAIVAALYTAMAKGTPVNTQIVGQEIRKTKPLSILMSEKVEGLRSWAHGRTVPAN